MKLRIQNRLQLLKAINWYQEQLALSLGQFLQTPARQEIAIRELGRLQAEQQSRESNSVWKVPVLIEFSPVGDYRVCVENERELLFLEDLRM